MEINHKTISAFLFSAALIVVAFQNCAKTNFSKTDIPSVVPPIEAVGKACELNYSPGIAQVSATTVSAPVTLSYALSKSFDNLNSISCNLAPTPGMNANNNLVGNVPILVSRPTTCTATYVAMDGAIVTCSKTIDVTCAADVLINVYSSTVQNFNITQKEIAIGLDGNSGCIDGANTAAQNMNLAGGDGRFRVTCATRWCDRHYGTNDSVGFVTSAPVYSSATNLNPDAQVNVQCRSNTANPYSVPDNVCRTIINDDKPVVAIQTTTADPSCGYCGCSNAAIVATMNQGVDAVKACSTRFCQAKSVPGKVPFKWGIMTEFFGEGFKIICSRAD